MTDRENPYRWDNHIISPEVELSRQELLDSAVHQLQRGAGMVLLGGRGMGKSVFLRQLERHLRQKPGVAVFTLDPPVVRSLTGALAELARVLEVPFTTDPAPPSARELVDQFLARQQHIQIVVLLFDELDQYAILEKDKPGPLGRLWFDHLESARKNTGRLGLLAAGGLGVYLLRHSFSSSFLSRAKWEKLLPLSPDELRRLAEPFFRHGRPLDTDILESIRLASGGNPALATYALENLWGMDRPTAALVMELYGRFQHEHRDFILSALRALTARELSGAPARLLELVRGEEGSIERKRLLQTADLQPDANLDLVDIFTLLESAGLVRLEGSPSADPVRIRPAASLLNIAMESHFQGNTEVGLISDLRELLSRMHAMGVDLLQSSRKMLPEAVYSAFLAMGLRLKGWEAEREAQHGAGRTDIKLWYPQEEDVGLVEVKIWGRNDYQSIHDQVCAYWSDRVVVGAAVMLTDTDVTAASYQEKCLGPPHLTVTAAETKPPLRAHFTVESRTADGATARVHHLLLRIPKRART